MRSIGVDLGTVRIGIALSDSGGLVATPYEVLDRKRTKRADHASIAELVRSVQGEVVVVGLPISLDGSNNPACDAARQEAAGIEAALRKSAAGAADPADPNDPADPGDAPVQVVLHDERFTTVEAERSLSHQKMKGPQRRRVVDKVAAAVLLQSWLDTQQPPVQPADQP